jgi:aminopeptidase N
LWDEHRFGLDEADFQAESETEGYFGSAENGGYFNLIRFDYADKEDMFDGHSYNKGGRILHMLRNYLGDEAFFKGLNLYLTSNKFKAAEVHNLRMAFEEVSGEDLNWFFNQWFLSSGHPVLEVTHKIDAATNTLVLTVKQLQNFNEFPIYKLPVDVAIWDEAGKTTSRIVVDSVEQNFYFPIKGTVKNVLFDEPQMLLGKVFEDKSTDEFIHQYYNAKRWKARNTALARVANIPGDKSARLLADALKDPFWSIRLSAINVIEKMEKEKAKTYVAQLKEMSLNDAKSDVRAAAIGCMEFMEADEATTFFKSFMAKEKSYTAIASGLGSYIKVDEKDALNVARGMKNEPAKALKVTIAEVIAQIGDSSDYDYLDQLIYHSDFKGYDELRTMISYAVYIMRMNIDLQEKSHAVYIHYNEVGGDLTKYWVKQAIQFNLQNYMQLVNSLEMEIAELEEGKSFAKADEKKRIKQRYEDLIQNLLPLGQSDESPVDAEGN